MTTYTTDESSFPIVLASYLQKLLNTRLITFLIDNKTNFKNQIGFMPNHRTTDHILVLKIIIETFKSSRKTLFLCFIDLRKVFDTVDHKGLIFKLIKQTSLSHACR